MDPKSSFSNTFDLNTQKGVMALLAAVRQSSLTNEEKNELRDLVFLYTNGGGDVSVKIALEQKLRTHQIQPVTPVVPIKESKPEPVKPPLPFGSSRPAPVFVAPVISKVVPREAKPEVKPKDIPLAVAKNNEPAKVATAPIEPKSIASVVPKSNQVPVPEPAPVSDVGQKTNAHLDRIREIKSAVNAKVGNPVNLVDIDNQVGREYMTALLEAMKRLSGGQPGGLEAAMSRLEAAYAAVLTAVNSHEQKQKNKAVVPEAVDNQAPVLSAVPDKPVLEVPKPPVPKPEPIKTEMEHQLEPKTPTIPRPPVSTPVVDSSPVKKFVSEPTPTTTSANLSNSPWSTPADYATPAVSLKSESLVEPVADRHQADSVAAPSNIATPSASPYKITSVLEEKKNLTPQDLPAMSKSASRAPVGDPLFTPEIEAGLSQLLSDWSLFKKSGLFGTGPKGKDHPLYKQIANLQIPLLLTGRFEGSTQEIKQSITDYMNGWRYEQGIIYEKGETFELYLRRVIKQILDLQKKRLSS